MRNADILLTDFNEIKLLYQYLYMSEEHYIDVKALGATLRITLTENLNFRCQNLNFPDLPATSYNDMMTLNQALGIIEQLKQTPGILGYQKNQSRWEEIAEITQIQVALTADNQRRHRRAAKPISYE